MDSIREGNQADGASCEITLAQEALCGFLRFCQRIPAHAPRQIKGQVDGQMLPYLQINGTASKAGRNIIRHRLNSKYERFTTISLKRRDMHHTVLVILIGNVESDFFPGCSRGKIREDIAPKISTPLRIITLTLSKKYFELGVPATARAETVWACLG